MVVEKKIVSSIWDYGKIREMIGDYVGSRLWMRLKTNDHTYVDGEVRLMDVYYRSGSETFNLPEADVGSFEGDLILQFSNYPLVAVPGENLILHILDPPVGFVVHSANMDFVSLEFEVLDHR